MAGVRRLALRLKNVPSLQRVAVVDRAIMRLSPVVDINQLRCELGRGTPEQIQRALSLTRKPHIGRVIEVRDKRRKLRVSFAVDQQQPMLQPRQPLDVSLDQRTLPRIGRARDERVGSELTWTQHHWFTGEPESQRNGRHTGAEDQIGQA